MVMPMETTIKKVHPTMETKMVVITQEMLMEMAMETKIKALTTEMLMEVSILVDKTEM